MSGCDKRDMWILTKTSKTWEKDEVLLWNLHLSQVSIVDYSSQVSLGSGLSDFRRYPCSSRLDYIATRTKGRFEPSLTLSYFISNWHTVSSQNSLHVQVYHFGSWLSYPRVRSNKIIINKLNKTRISSCSLSWFSCLIVNLREKKEGCFSKLITSVSSARVTKKAGLNT